MKNQLRGGTFPFAIVFIEADAFVRVSSVMHGHRRPEYWKRRL